MSCLLFIKVVTFINLYTVSIRSKVFMVYSIGRSQQVNKLTSQQVKQLSYNLTGMHYNYSKYID